MDINSRFLLGYIEDRLELLRESHKHSIDDSSYRIQMLSRIDELEAIKREVEIIINIK